MKEKTEKKLTEDQRKALTRAFALRKEGRTWKEVANILKLDGFANQRKEPYTDTCLRGWYFQLNGKIPVSEVDHTAKLVSVAKVDTIDTPEQPVIVDKSAIIEEPITGDTIIKRSDGRLLRLPLTTDNVDTPNESPVSADTVTREELSAMMTALEDRLTNLIDAKLKAPVATSGRGVKDDNVDEPPLPPKTGPAGKKFLGSKGDIRVRCDSVLVSLFERFAEQHFGGNLSRAMDAALWHFFSKPALSFEKDPSSDN